MCNSYTNVSSAELNREVSDDAGGDGDDMEITDDDGGDGGGGDDGDDDDDDTEIADDVPRGGRLNEPGATSGDPAPLLLRRVLHIVFGVFPMAAGGDGLADTASSLLQGDPAFGFWVESHPQFEERRLRYTEYVQKASAWVSTVLRKLDRPDVRGLVAEDFRMDDESRVEEQVALTRSLLIPMEAAFSNLYFKRGNKEGCDICGADGGRRTNAYVYTGRGKVWGEHSGRTTNDGRYIINICENYWCRGATEGRMIGTVVHEVSHMYGTTDKNAAGQAVYPHKNWEPLSYDEAKRLAAVYQVFVEHVVLL